MGAAESGLTGRDLCCGIQPQGRSATQNPGFLRNAAAVPKVLEDFLEARRVGNVDAAAVCCTEDMTMRGPMGEFAGLEVVRTKAFSKPSQPLGKTLMLLQYIPNLSTANEAVYAREFEAQIGYAQVPLRQEVREAPPRNPAFSLATAPCAPRRAPAGAKKMLIPFSLCAASSAARAVRGAQPGHGQGESLPRGLLEAQRLSV